MSGVLETRLAQLFFGFGFSERSQDDSSSFGHLKEQVDTIFRHFISIVNKMSIFPYEPGQIINLSREFSILCHIGTNQGHLVQTGQIIQSVSSSPCYVKLERTPGLLQYPSRPNHSICLEFSIFQITKSGRTSLMDGNETLATSSWVLYLQLFR